MESPKASTFGLWHIAHAHKWYAGDVINCQQSLHIFHDMLEVTKQTNNVWLHFEEDSGWTMKEGTVFYHWEHDGWNLDESYPLT